MDILHLIRLEVLVGLGAAVSVITELVKAIPKEFTSSHPKTVAWVVTAVGVGILGVIEGAEIATMLVVIPPIALVAHGIYDVIKSLYQKIRK